MDFPELNARRFQFSLRSLFIATAAIGGLFGVCIAFPPAMIVVVPCLVCAVIVWAAILICRLTMTIANWLDQ